MQSTFGIYSLVLVLLHISKQIRYVWVVHLPKLTSFVLTEDEVLIATGWNSLVTFCNKKKKKAKLDVLDRKAPNEQLRITKTIIRTIIISTSSISKGNSVKALTPTNNKNSSAWERSFGVMAWNSLLKKSKAGTNGKITLTGTWVITWELNPDAHV